MDPEFQILFNLKPCSGLVQRSFVGGRAMGASSEALRGGVLNLDHPERVFQKRLSLPAWPLHAFAFNRHQSIKALNYPNHNVTPS